MHAKNKTYLYAMRQETHITPKDTYRLRNWGWEKILCKLEKKPGWPNTLITHRYFKTQGFFITRNGHYTNKSRI